MATKTTNYNLTKPEQTDFYNVDDFNNNADIIDATLVNKVDKVPGKHLSSNDYTNEDKEKIAGLPANPAEEFENKVDKTDFTSHTDNNNIHVTSGEKTKWNNKAEKQTVVLSTMVSTGWSGSEYSFEQTYPNAQYDIEISASSTCTAAQFEAFNGAQIASNATNNIAKAMGVVPKVDIPIVIKVVKK